MAKKRQVKKNYSVEDIYKYHEKRANDKTLSKNKRCYSENWLHGFNDPHAKENIIPLTNEMNARRRIGGEAWNKTDRIFYHGEVNGTKAQLTSEGSRFYHKKEYEEFIKAYPKK